jgi:ribose transport system substrate-binding protein
MTNEMRSKARQLCGYAMVTLIIGSSLTACGKSAAAVATGEPSGGSSSALSTKSSSALSTKLSQYASVPTFNVPGPAFDAQAAAKGKSVAIVPASSSIPFVQTIAQGMQAAGPKIGLGVTVLQNQGQTSQWSQAVGIATSQHASSIDLLAGIDPALLGPQIAQAKSAGVGTVASHFYGVGQTPAPALAGTVDAPYGVAGQLLADYAINKTNGKLNALVVTINQVLSTAPMVDGIKKEVGTYCASTCKVTYTNASIANLATNVPTAVRGALQRDPKINYIIALYDSALVPYVLSGVESAGATAKVKIVTFNGTPSILKLVASGKVEMDVGENLNWVALAILDQHLRLLAGLSPVADENLPLRIWDASNISQAGSQPQNSVGYGTSFVTGYQKLWKLPPGATLGGLG